jgi:hypothetical protein
MRIMKFVMQNVGPPVQLSTHRVATLQQNQLLHFFTQYRKFETLQAWN